jgi:hypothetical protein
LADYEQYKNFAISTIATAPSPATSGTSLVVAAGEGTRFGSTFSFNAIIAPADAQPTPANAEIVRVTARPGSADTFTITRAQESTSARTVLVGDRIYAGPTQKTFSDIDDVTTLILAAYTPKSLLDAKGDIFAASANDTPAKVTVGTNAQLLQADSSATAGVSWTSNFDRDFGLPGIMGPQPYIWGTASTALTANRATVARVVPSRDQTITIVSFNVSAFASADDACDVGYYTVSGSDLSKVSSTGATTGKLNTATGVKTFTGLSWPLTAGTVYYIAFSSGTQGGTAASLTHATMSGGGFDLFGTTVGKSLGMFKATSHPLPTTLTAPTTGSGGVPMLAFRES